MQSSESVDSEPNAPYNSAADWSERNSFGSPRDDELDTVSREHEEVPMVSINAAHSALSDVVAVPQIDSESVNDSVIETQSDSFCSVLNVVETEAVSVPLIGGWNGDRGAALLGVESLESDRGWKDPP